MFPAVMLITVSSNPSDVRPQYLEELMIVRAYNEAAKRLDIRFEPWG